MQLPRNRHTSPAAPGDRLLLTSSLAWLHAIGGSLSVVWLLLPHATGARESLIVAATLGAYAIAAILFVRGSRMSLAVAQLLMLGTTAVISLAAAASAERGSVYGLFYLWATLYAFSFFSRRQALVQVAAVAAAYALVLTVQLTPTPWNEDLTRWVMTIVTLLAAGWLVRTLHRAPARARAAPAARDRAVGTGERRDRLRRDGARCQRGGRATGRRAARRADRHQRRSDPATPATT